MTDDDTQHRTNKRSRPIAQAIDYVLAPHRSWLNVSTNYDNYDPFTPNALPAAYNEARELTQHLHRIALLGRLPMGNSQGLEMLLFRLVKVNERLADVLAEILEQMARTAVDLPTGVDGVYQPGYCDRCGWELNPDSCCINQNCSEYQRS